MGNEPSTATNSKPNLPGRADNPNCEYCRIGRRWGWPFKNVFHTHDATQPLTPDKPISIDHLKDFFPDVKVNTEEVEGANKAINQFFEGTGIDPKVQLDFDIVIFLAKLHKFRIEKPFNVSEQTERMITYARGGNFREAFKILDDYPVIVNYIPPDRAWGLLHQAAYFNDYDAVKKILENPKCDPFLCTKQTREDIIKAGSTAYLIAKDPKVKMLIKQYEEIKLKSLKAKSMPTLVSIDSEQEIEVESIVLTLNCFENVLHPKTLNSKHSLIYSNLMSDIFEFINLGSNWKRARRAVSLQLQSINVYAATFLATGKQKGNIMDMDLLGGNKSDFYSRVIGLYTQQCPINLRYGGKGSNQFYSALNTSLRTHGHGSNPSFVSGEDLAFAAYGILLNSILMYWTNIIPTNEPTFRAMNLPPEAISAYKEGETFTWLCFTSSSRNESVAKCFGTCMFICDNTQGTKYAAKGIKDDSAFEGEEEFLYPSGARFRITSIDKSNGFTTFRIRLEDY